MKKIFAITLLMMFCATVVSASTYTKYSRKFIKNFKDCDYYNETETSAFQDRTFNITRKIIGWKNGFCRYEETISSSTDKFKLTCNFTDMQIEELYKAMKNRSKEPEVAEIETFKETVDKNGQKKYTSIGTATAKGNKAFITWTKYQNNPYFCKPEKLN